MGRQKYLVDTNVAIDYIGEALPEEALFIIDDVIDGQFYISVINKIELLGYAGITEDEELKFQEFIDAANVFDLDGDIVNSTIEIRKHYKTKLPDAIIAATAIVNDLALITRNTRDFQKINGLILINPLDLP